MVPDPFVHEIGGDLQDHIHQPSPHGKRTLARKHIDNPRGRRRPHDPVTDGFGNAAGMGLLHWRPVSSELYQNPIEITVIVVRRNRRRNRRTMKACAFCWWKMKRAWPALSPKACVKRLTPSISLSMAG